MRPPLTIFCILITLTTLCVQAKNTSIPSKQEAITRLNTVLEKSLTEKGTALLPAASDSLFLRRAYLKIIGRIPTMEETQNFLKSEAVDKKQELVQNLIQSPGYISHSFNYWADLLRVDSRKNESGLGWHLWIKHSIATDKPYNEFVAEMIAAEGDSADNPAVGYFLRDRGMLLDNVANTAEVFLGQQIACAQCHDHPFDDLSQREYYEFSAFFGGISYHSKTAENRIKEFTGHSFGDLKNKKFRKKNRQSRKALAPLLRPLNRNAISEAAHRQVKLPKDYKYDDGKPGEIIKPSPLYLPSLSEISNQNRRDKVREWLTSPKNIYFTKNIANRLWARVFGHGLVHPLENLAEYASSPHPEVLSTLESIIKEQNYQLRDVLEILYSTNLFQASAQAHSGSAKTIFTGPLLERMTGEQLHDSLLTLQVGKVDASENTELSHRWERYQKQIADLKQTAVTELKNKMQLANKLERETRQLRLQVRTIRQQAKKLREQGDREAAKEMYKQAREIDQQANAIIKGSGMAMMQRLAAGAAPKQRLRASEYPTPFNGNHLVRRFGGSDRMTPSSTRTDASIPQALTLLNGEVARLSFNGKSKLAKTLQGIKNREERLEAIFLTIYNTMPKRNEIRELKPHMNDRESVQTLIRAMLGSNRFLFIE